MLIKVRTCLKLCIVIRIVNKALFDLTSLFVQVWRKDVIITSVQWRGVNDGGLVISIVFVYRFSELNVSEMQNCG